MGVFKTLTVFAGLLVVCARAQRPFYASSGQYPPVLPQNLPSTTAGGADLGNRIGGEPTTSNPWAINPEYNVEQGLIDRVKDLPRDKQPFWYLNNAQLNSFKNPNGQGQRVQPVNNIVQPQQRLQVGGPASQQGQRSQEQYLIDLEQTVRRQEEDLRRTREQLRRLQQQQQQA